MPARAQEVVITPGKSALLVLGVENDFVSPKGKLYPGPATRTRAASMKRLLARARQARMKIFFIHSVRSADSPEFSVFGLTPYLVEGTWGSEFAEGMGPVFDEEVVEARTFDCFVKTNIEHLFRKYDVQPLGDHVIVMGGIANVSIYHAASGLSQRHFNVIVPRDCVFGDRAGEERIMRQLSESPLSYNTMITISRNIRIRESLGLIVKSY